MVESVNVCPDFSVYNSVLDVINIDINTSKLRRFQSLCGLMACHHKMCGFLVFFFIILDYTDDTLTHPSGFFFVPFGVFAALQAATKYFHYGLTCWLPSHRAVRNNQFTWVSEYYVPWHCIDFKLTVYMQRFVDRFILCFVLRSHCSDCRKKVNFFFHIPDLTHIVVCSLNWDNFPRIRFLKTKKSNRTTWLLHWVSKYITIYWFVTWLSIHLSKVLQIDFLFTYGSEYNGTFWCLFVDWLWHRTEQKCEQIFFSFNLSLIISSFYCCCLVLFFQIKTIWNTTVPTTTTTSACKNKE